MTHFWQRQVEDESQKLSTQCSKNFAFKKGLAAQRILFPTLLEVEVVTSGLASLSLYYADESQYAANEILTTAHVCRIRRQVHTAFASRSTI